LSIARQFTVSGFIPSSVTNRRSGCLQDESLWLAWLYVVAVLATLKSDSTLNVETIFLARLLKIDQII